MDHTGALSNYVTMHQQVVKLCLWRLQRNDPEMTEEEIFPLAAEVQWSDWFGQDPKDPSRSYTLLGRGFFQAASAENTEQVIHQWLAQHPEATLRPVGRLPWFGARQAKSELIYVWVVDRDHNLNLHLVEQGCVPAGTMESPVIEVEAPFQDYLEFLKSVVAGEESARDAGLGYWGSREVRGEDLRGQAYRLKSEGRYAEALKAFEELVRSGASSQMWLDVGECHEELEQWDEAIAAYDRAIGDGGWWPPYTRKAHCLRRSQGLEEAVGWLEWLASESPTARSSPTYWAASCGRVASRVARFPGSRRPSRSPARSTTSGSTRKVG